ncbi:hypothetical protein E2562_012428 [Oryza meyeriana var. granulata]|uniref:Uncharacterized protein n=1 Tax=Oryza meyeriana var. granulata TaxID=110450 RepID=A0A6G1C5G4_9ORYZ|nr:hypothetical protein E2562_012428 [Oryza meyeriana var. granulata]
MAATVTEMETGGGMTVQLLVKRMDELEKVMDELIRAKRAKGEEVVLDGKRKTAREGSKRKMAGERSGKEKRRAKESTNKEAEAGLNDNG